MEDSFFGQKETGAERVAMATVLRASFFFVMGNCGAKFQRHYFNISRDTVFFSILQSLVANNMTSSLI